MNNVFYVIALLSVFGGVFNYLEAVDVERRINKLEGGCIPIIDEGVLNAG